jgi:hypothetical protein
VFGSHNILKKKEKLNYRKMKTMIYMEIDLEIMCVERKTEMGGTERERERERNWARCNF